MEAERSAAEAGLEQVRCENETLSLTVLPELGAKVISLRDREHDREWIASPERPYGRARRGDDFADFDSGGWDECFPNVGAGRVTVAGRELELVDHGELWSRPWQVGVSGDAVTTTVAGDLPSYVFERRLELLPRRVEARYRLKSTSEQPFPCLWAMHPLIAVGSGTRIVLPGVTSMLCDAAPSAARFGGYHATVSWPVAATVDGLDEDLSVHGGRETFALKLFTPRLRAGRAAVIDGDADAVWLGFAFDPAACPYLGVWLNEGGWPADEPLQHLALEPTSGRADVLEAAMRVGDTWLLQPGEVKEWSVEIAVGSGTDSLAAFLAEER